MIRLADLPFSCVAEIVETHIDTVSVRCGDLLLVDQRGNRLALLETSEFVLVLSGEGLLHLRCRILARELSNDQLTAIARLPGPDRRRAAEALEQVRAGAAMLAKIWPQGLPWER